MLDVKYQPMNSVFFYILIRAWHSYDNFDNCINSIFKQNYNKYQILFVDDATPLSKLQKQHITQKLKGHIAVFNKKRLYSLRNSYQMIHKFAKKDKSVIFNLDGDDWLPHPRCLEIVASCYKENSKCQLTYGDCFIWDGKKNIKSAKSGIPFVNIPYPKYVVKNHTYRRHFFMALHPRTWRVSLYKKIKRSDFLRPNNSWLRFAEDQAIFFPLLEMAGENFKVIKRPIYVYNVATDLSDVKTNYLKLLKDELIIRRKKPYAPAI
jgi:glycosyltransferase involved in cell wall biosynthesis